MPQHKGLIIILDGLGDRPHVELAGRTPLEAAATPTMNALVKRGQGGLVNPLYPWIPVGTQTGVGLLMGLARSQVNVLMRGPIEAAGVGLDIGPGDVAIRCNIATLKDDANRTIVNRRAGRTPDGMEELLATIEGARLTDDITVSLRAATQHRVVAVLTGPNLSQHVTDTDPGPGRGSDGIQLCFPLDAEEGSRRTAEAINHLVDLSIQKFGDHPVNDRRVAEGLLPIHGLITRSAGTMQPVKNIVTHLGLKAAVVTGERTAVGLGRIFGFTVISEQAFDGTVNTDIDGKVRAAMEALDEHDVVFVHFKGADIAAHDQNPVIKKRYLEKVDAALGRHDLSQLVVGVTGDHSTDSTSGWHTGDPLPTLIAAPSTRVDKVKRFGERHCGHGGLGHLSATAFLCACLDLMGYARQYRPAEAALFDVV